MNNEYKFEKGIPIPTKAAPTLRKMKPGDSVLLPAKNAAQRAHAAFGSGNYVSRKESGGKTRIWRIK